MRLPALAAAALLALPLLTLAASPAPAQDKCDPQTMSAAIEERMKSENKSPSDIADVVNSGFKRRILEGRIRDQSGCPDEAVSSAVDLLAQKYK